MDPVRWVKERREEGIEGLLIVVTKCGVTASVIKGQVRLAGLMEKVSFVDELFVRHHYMSRDVAAVLCEQSVDPDVRRMLADIVPVYRLWLFVWESPFAKAAFAASMVPRTPYLDEQRRRWEEHEELKANAYNLGI